MRQHTLEATGGQTYAQMGQYLDATGKPTNDERPPPSTRRRKPVSKRARKMWVTETALTTALNTAYFAENVANFAIVMGSRSCSPASASSCSRWWRCAGARTPRPRAARRPRWRRPSSAESFLLLSSAVGGAIPPDPRRPKEPRPPFGAGLPLVRLSRLRPFRSRFA